MEGLDIWNDAVFIAREAADMSYLNYEIVLFIGGVDCTCCCNCVLKWFVTIETQAYLLQKDC